MQVERKLFFVVGGSPVGCGKFFFFYLFVIGSFFFVNFFIIIKDRLQIQMTIPNVVCTKKKA